MNNVMNLANIKREPLHVVLGDIASSDDETSRRAGVKLVQKAKSYGINVRDYLNLSLIHI